MQNDCLVSIIDPDQIYRTHATRHTSCVVASTPIENAFPRYHCNVGGCGLVDVGKCVKITDSLTNQLIAGVLN